MKRPFHRGRSRPRPPAQRPPSEPVRVKIERMAPEGQGLGRTTTGGPGKVVFVDYAAPGDLLEAQLQSAKPGWASATIHRVLEPGPGRITAPCPYHFQPGRVGRWCGGCDWQQLSDSAQLEAKREIVVDSLRRIGRIAEPRVEPVIPSPQRWRYRNKVQVPFGTREGRIIAGFYAPGSHEIVDFDDCPVQPELSVRIVRRVKELATEYRWPVYDERAHRGWLRHLLVRVTQDGRAHAVVVGRSHDFPKREQFVTAMRESFPELAGIHQNVQEDVTSVILGPHWRKLWGADTLQERVGRLRLRASPGAFLQVNTPACEKLYDQAATQLTAGGFSPLITIDLYCGVGAIALWIAPKVRRVLGIEENPQAVADAWENARLNGVNNARFIAGRAETLLGRLRDEFTDAPPGVPAVRRIVYVSCNPATFARDAAALVGFGFALKTVQPVDLFPQTSHVELAATLERAP